MIQAVQEIEGVHGVHIMAYKQEERLQDIVEESGVLEGEFRGIRVSVTTSKVIKLEDN